MGRNRLKNFIMCFSVAALLLIGCGNSTTTTEQEDTSQFPIELYSEEDTVTLEEALAEPMVPLAGDPKATILQAPQAAGKVVYTSGGSKDVTIDASNTAEGYGEVQW